MAIDDTSFIATPDAPEDLIREVERFRVALEAIDPALWQACASTTFPIGACGHAAELLGRHLHDALQIEAEYVLRDFYDADGEWSGGHAWIEWDGFIIDISGDQFGWPPVIISRSSPLHAAGNENIRQPLTSDMRWWGNHAAPLYHAARDWLSVNISN